MNILLLPLVIFLMTVNNIDSAKILAALPFPSISHQVVFRPFTQELARRGHEVVVITPNPAFSKENTPKNLTEIDLQEISYTAWLKALKKADQGKKYDLLTVTKYFTNAMNDIAEAQFKSEVLQKLLKDEKEFDLVIAEACMVPALIFSHIYKAPVILISSFGAAFLNGPAMGLQTHPLLYPSLVVQKTYNLTTWEKLNNLYDYFRLHSFATGSYIEAVDELLKRNFGDNIPSIIELNKNVDMMFSNIHSMWERNIPTPPGYIRIWGIHKRVEQELPEDLKSYLDSSENGVIYMSLGTNAFPSMLPPEKIQAFIKAFSELPYDVLFKYDADELPGRSANIKIGKWFPQSDLLRHPKLKLFITQGGIQSTEEAINSGVPLVVLPMLGDQFYNSETIVKFGIGEKLRLETLTADDVKNSIQTVINGDSYRENIIKLRTLMRDEPEPALERAVWWTEYVLRHKGARHLRAAAANLSWTEYYELELIRNIVICIATALLGLIVGIKFVAKSFVVHKSKEKKN